MFASRYGRGGGERQKEMGPNSHRCVLDVQRVQANDNSAGEALLRASVCNTEVPSKLPRSPSSALLPFLFWGRVPLLK